MRRLAPSFLIAFALLAIFAVAAALGGNQAARAAQSKPPAKSAAKSPSDLPLNSSYDALRPQQRALFEKSFPASTGQKPADRYAALTPSQQSTFYAVTHALLYTTLHSKTTGKPLVNALSLVLGVEEILGGQKGLRGDKQFRLYARMNPKSAEILAQAREFFRDKDNGIFHKGYPVNFRLGGRVPSIQFSLAEDSTRSDIDVDYRSSRIPVGLVNGHLSAANSDVRPNRNYRGHLRRWQGLIAWWKRLFAFDEPADVPPAPAAHVAGEAPADKPDNAAFGSIEETVSEFLHDWIVRRNVKSAMLFYSPQTTARTNSDEDPENEALAPAEARKQFLAILNEVNRCLGKCPNLASAIEAEPAWDDTYRLIDHPAKAQFALYSITDEEAAEYLTSKTAAKTSNYGNYFLTVFQIRLSDDAGGVLSLLWKKEGNTWRIISFDVEEH